MPSSKRTITRRATVSTKRTAVPARGSVNPVRRFGTRFKFIGDTITEMKKVTWLTRREALYLTGLVLLVAVSVGVVLGLLDLGLSEIVTRFLLGG
jgi:preprotein translocase subunit SecE